MRTGDFLVSACWWCCCCCCCRNPLVRPEPLCHTLIITTTVTCSFGDRQLLLQLRRRFRGEFDTRWELSPTPLCLWVGGNSTHALTHPGLTAWRMTMVEERATLDVRHTWLPLCECVSPVGTHGVSETVTNENMTINSTFFIWKIWQWQFDSLSRNKKVM